MSASVTPPVTLSSGRIVLHTREPNGSQLATPTPGNYEMTNAEWLQYCQITSSVKPKPIGE